MPKKPNKKKDWMDLTRWIASGVLFLICLILSLVSNNNDFLFSVGGMCLTRSFLFASVIVLVFLRRRQLFWPLMIYATAFAFLISYLPLMLSAKINAIVMFSVAILGGLLLIALRFRKKDKLDSGLWVGCPAFLSLVPAVSLSMKADFTSEMPFWIPPLVIGFVALIATGIISWRRMKKKPENTKKKKPKWLRCLGWSLCGFIISWCIVWGSLTSLNICFDFSKPTLETVKVLEKDIDRGWKRPTLYELSFESDGRSHEIAVPKYFYDEIEVGDSFTVAFLEGLLGESYYIYPGYV